MKLTSFQVNTFEASTNKKLVTLKDIKHPINAIDAAKSLQSQKETAMIKVIPDTSTGVVVLDKDIDICNDLFWSYY